MIIIEVPGIPVGQGALRRSPNGPGLYETSKGHGPWREAIIYAARQAWAGAEPWLGPIQLEAIFIFPRPKSHYGSGRNAGAVKDSAPLAHSKKPDLDHLQRSVGDALTGAGCIRDDAQIACWAASKAYGAQPGLRLQISKL